MKTNLPKTITTVEEAQAFLKELYTNGEAYHPEDDAHDIVWNNNNWPTLGEQMKLNRLMEDIYNLPGNDGRHCDPMIFDPCTFLLELDPEYLQRIADDDNTVFTSAELKPEELVFKFARNTHFIGRNGRGHQSGISVLNIQNDYFSLSPTIGKGDVGNCTITIPKESVQAFINQLSNML